MCKLSLIVPIYGVEKYIPKFLDSLTPNLLPGVEVLLIDDGSKDNSGRIADEYAEMHKEYVKIIHKENGGVSSARNAGLEIARGEYVLFPDPDDRLREDYVLKIFNAIKQYNSPDMIMFGFYYGSDELGYKTKSVNVFKEGFVQVEKFIKEFVKDDNIQSMVWCKAIKRKFYQNHTFNTKINVCEDYELLTDLVLDLEKIVYLPEALYYYLVRESSLTQTSNLNDSIIFCRLRYERFLKFKKCYDNISNCDVVKAYSGILGQIYQYEDKFDISKYENYIKLNIKEILLASDIKLSLKKRCLLIYLGIAKYYYKLKPKKSSASKK